MLQDVLQKEKKKFYRYAIVMVVLIMLIIGIAVTLGASNIGIIEGYTIIFKQMIGQPVDEIKTSIVWDIRLPRILAGCLIGAGLSVSGVIFQSVLRNPLADPYTIGVSTGAAFGAVLTIYINMVYQMMIPITPVAFVFAILTLGLIFKIVGETLHSTKLILAGIIVGSVFSAGISLLKHMAGEDVSAMIFWLMGRLTATSWREVILMFPIVTIAIFLTVSHADDLDVLTLGINEASSVGVDSHKRARIFLIMAALLTAVCVSTSGIIGFVGLIVPHLLRIGFSAKHRYLLPLSALMGALVLMIADNFARLMFEVEMPVGVVTTLIGGPFFIYIYMKRKGDIL